MGVRHGRERRAEDRQGHGFSGASDPASAQRLHRLQPRRGAGGHPVLYRHIYKSGTARFTRWAQNVWGIAPKGSDEETAAAGIDALAAFIKEIGLPTSFAELGIPADTDFRAVADSTNITAGCCKKLTRDEICEILQECL